MSPSWYEVGRSTDPTRSAGQLSIGLRFPLCDVRNHDHDDVVTHAPRDHTIGFRVYGYYRAFCALNHL